MSNREFFPAEYADDSPAELPREASGAGRQIRPLQRDALALLLARHEVRSLRRHFEEFDRDILLPILLGEIALHNIGTLDHSGAGGKARRERLQRPLRPCNTYSIAAATNLPRETVRRKVARLIAHGWIEREDNGHLFITPEAMRRFGDVLLSRELSELLELAEKARQYMSG